MPDFKPKLVQVRPPFLSTLPRKSSILGLLRKPGGHREQAERRINGPFDYEGQGIIETPEGIGIV